MSGLKKPKAIGIRRNSPIAPANVPTTAACFHAQQCVEKYLEAKLNEAWIVPRKTHNLSDLLDDVLPAGPTWAALRPVLNALTKYAVLHHYPKYNTTKIEAKAAVKDCCEVRRVIRTAFGLPI